MIKRAFLFRTAANSKDCDFVIMSNDNVNCIEVGGSPLNADSVYEKTKTMYRMLEQEDAMFAVPTDGRGFLLCRIAAPPDSWRDDGLLRTTAGVLVFTDVRVVEGPRDDLSETPHCDPERLDLCPNIRKVKLGLQ